MDIGKITNAASVIYKLMEIIIIKTPINVVNEVII